MTRTADTTTIKHRVILTSIIAFLAVNLALAQTPPAPGQIGEVTFNAGHMRASMTPEELEKYKKETARLEKLQKDANRYPKGDETRAILEAALEPLLAEFKADYAIYEGIRDQTVTVYGDPLPRASQIIAQVLTERRRTGKVVSLAPYWQRLDNGTIVGLKERPQGQPDPAGTTAGPLLPVDMPREGGLWQRRPDGFCRDLNWDFDTYPNPVCYCAGESQWGVTVKCTWKMK